MVSGKELEMFNVNVLMLSLKYINVMSVLYSTTYVRGSRRSSYRYDILFTFMFKHDLQHCIRMWISRRTGH